ncbi:hypothetical protein C0L75_02915 [Clostridium perfringens]
MDWCWYLAVKILGMSEEEFFKSTPKKLFKLAEIHSKVNSSPEEQQTKEEKEVYIDEFNL